jgi:hypothetical protein
MLRGKKSLAMAHLDLLKPKEQAKWKDAIRAGKIIHKRGPTGTKGYDTDYFTVPGQEWRMDKMAEIFNHVQATDMMTDDDHEVLGKLLGYSDEDIDLFIGRAPGLIGEQQDWFKGSTFSDEQGNEFDVETVVAFAKENANRYLRTVPMSKIEHDLEWWEQDPNKERMMGTDTRYPILVVVDRGHWSVADGLNRMKKARDVEHKTAMAAYVVPKEDIAHLASRDMKEAPVRDFEVDPSVNQYYHGTWNRRDQQMLNQPKMKEITTRRIKTAIPIDMHFIGLIQMDKSAKWMSSQSPTAGTMTDKFREFLSDYSGVMSAKAAEQQFGVEIEPATDAISVLYLSNTNDVASAIPFTPWIMTHRLGHSLEDAARNKQLGPDARGAEDILANSVVNGMDDDEDSILKQSITPFLTMKSAKQMKLDEGEAVPEMIAQFLYEGKVRLARAVLPSGQRMIRLDNGLFPHAEIPDVAQFNILIEQEEQRINQLVGTIVKGAIGLLVVAP